MQGPPPHKRQRGAIVTVPEPEPLAPTHASSLPSLTLQLTGHKGSVYGLEYSPAGRTLCSASFDMTCLLWSHSSGGADDEEQLESYQNFNVLQGHKNAVLDCHWCDEDTVVTCGADKTVQLWDALTGKRLRKWQEHSGIVNACAVVSEDDAVVVSASDDGCCLLWDRRQKRSTGILSVAADYDDTTPSFPVTAVAAHSDYVYTGGLDNLIHCWDLRTKRKVYSMKGHTDSITCLALHPEKTHLLSNSMDHSLRTWDIRPFVSAKSKRHCKTFTGHKHNAEKGLLKCSWSPNGSMVTAGSADKMVHIWDEFSTQELYLLPGHKGCVNTVVFHPTENVIASGASDKHIFVGELS